ncbi:MAG: hypothetical protein RIR70_1620 [Pseudomonadota bacterium]|jgi:hypothetical protein
MLIVRLLAMLAVAAIGGAVVLYLFTRERKYLNFAWFTGKLLVVVLLVFFGLMIIERLAVL